MKESGFICNAWEVRAILEGRKTQTRRMVNPQPTLYLQPGSADYEKPWLPIGGVYKEDWPCPYGAPGDQLWVKETLSTLDCHHGQLVYRADGAANLTDMKWKPSIHMPRWASRITLEIESVRVEKLQEIDEDSAWAEGMNHGCIGNDESFAARSGNDWPYENFGFPAKMRFAQLWQSINGPGSWGANTWVWVIQFRRVK